MVLFVRVLAVRDDSVVRVLFWRLGMIGWFRMCEFLFLWVGGWVSVSRPLRIFSKGRSNSISNRCGMNQTWNRNGIDAVRAFSFKAKSRRAQSGTGVRPSWLRSGIDSNRGGIWMNSKWHRFEIEEFEVVWTFDQREPHSIEVKSKPNRNAVEVKNQNGTDVQSIEAPSDSPPCPHAPDQL